MILSRKCTQAYETLTLISKSMITAIHYALQLFPLIILLIQLIEKKSYQQDTDTAQPKELNALHIM